MHIHVHDHVGLILSLLMVVVGIGSLIDTYRKKRPKASYLFSVGFTLVGFGSGLGAIDEPILQMVSGGVAISGVVLMSANFLYSEVKRTLAGDKERGAV